ncbi:glycosyltransferase involved in cell wall biosynthesis [Pedobacter sp. UYEF25]
MTALVSVIIPVYNCENHLGKTIECAVNQTWPNIEIIVIDDGSTDNSLQIANKYAADFKNVKIFSQKNNGASSARNLGLENCKGEYIQFLDADDLLSPTKIETQVDILKNNNNCMTSCSWVRFKNNTTETIGEIGPHESISKTLTPTQWLLKQHTMLTHAWLCPRSIIDKAGKWDTSLTYNDDGEYFARVVAHAENLIFVPNVKAYYRLSKKNLNLSNLNSETKHYSAYLASLTYKNVIYKLTNKSPAAQVAFGNHLKQIMFGAYPKYNKVVKACLSHDEIRLANIHYEGGGLLSIFLVNIIGWKLTKKLKTFVSKF